LPIVTPQNKAATALIERLEGSFYEEFIRQDLRRQLEEAGFSILVYEEMDAVGIFLGR